MDYKREIEKLLDEISDSSILRRIYLIIVAMKKKEADPWGAASFLFARHGRALTGVSPEHA